MTSKLWFKQLYLFTSKNENNGTVILRVTTADVRRGMFSDLEIQSLACQTTSHRLSIWMHRRIWDKTRSHKILI